MMGNIQIKLLVCFCLAVALVLVLALAAGLALPISGAEAVAKSWPDFLEAIKPLGAEVEHVG